MSGIIKKIYTVWDLMNAYDLFSLILQQKRHVHASVRVSGIMKKTLTVWDSMSAYDLLSSSRFHLPQKLALPPARGSVVVCDRQRGHPTLAYAMESPK